MRVLHVDTGREWRGGQTQLLHLLRARPDDEVVLAPDAPLREAVESLGVRVHPIAFRGVWRGTRALAEVVRARAPDLVAAHTSHAQTHAWRAGGAPVVVHRRSDFVPGPLSGAKYRGVRGYVAVSEAVRAVLARRGVAPERVKVVPDGVDPRGWSSEGPVLDRAVLDVPAGSFLVGAAGALVMHKGHDVLLEALALLRRHGVPAFVVIAGEGARRGRLLRRARRLGLAGALRLPGRVADVGAFLRALDAFAHPSREEGFGQAVIEARLVGVPIVATTAGGLPEALGQGGALVPAGDAQRLAAALAEIRADPAAARRRAVAGRVGARGFSVERMVGGTEQAWEALLAAAR